MNTRSQKRTFFLFSLMYASLWTLGLLWFVGQLIFPQKPQEVQSEIPQLNIALVEKISQDLTGRQPADLSQSFDTSAIQFGKPEPFE